MNKKSIEEFEKLKKERIKDNASREKNRKVVRFLNRLVIIETIIGLVVLLIIYLFFMIN